MKRNENTNTGVKAGNGQEEFVRKAYQTRDATVRVNFEMADGICTRDTFP